MRGVATAAALVVALSCGGCGEDGAPAADVGTVAAAEVSDGVAEPDVIEDAASSAGDPIDAAGPEVLPQPSGPAALEREWTQAPAGFADAPLGAGEPDASVRGAVAADVDLDGDMDIVLATALGARVLENQGAAGLRLREEFDPLALAVVPEVPGGVADVRAIAAAGGDVVLCTAAGRDVWLAAGDGGLAVEELLPWRRGECVDTAVSSSGEISLLVAAEGGVALHIPGAESTLLPHALSATLPFATATEDPDVEPVASWSLDQPAQGVGAARLDYSVTTVGPEVVFTLPLALSQHPDRLELLLRSDGAPVIVTARLLGSDGQSYQGPQLVDGPDWEPTVLADLASWGPAEGELAALQIAVITTVAAAVTGWLEIDHVTAHSAGHVPWLIDDFERYDPRHQWPDAEGLVRGDVDGDGVDDLMVQRSAEATLLTGDGASLGEFVSTASVSLTASGGALGLLDADVDGAVDLIHVGPGQDRLWVGDGWGHFADATQGSLPIDWAQGTCVATGDLDRDGAVDLVIGNDGGTDRLYVGRGDGRFLDATPALGFDTLGTVAVLLVDLDGDDALDVVSVDRDGSVPPQVRFHTGGELQ